MSRHKLLIAIAIILLALDSGRAQQRPAHPSTSLGSEFLPPGYRYQTTGDEPAHKSQPLSRAKTQTIDTAYISEDGNVRIVTHEGRDIKITRTGHCDNAKVATDGQTVGWLASYENLATKLVIYRKGRIIRTIAPGGFIRDWRFWKDGTQAAVLSGGLHFAGTSFLYDIATGRQLEHNDCQGLSDEVGCPEWTRDPDR